MLFFMTMALSFAGPLDRVDEGFDVSSGPLQSIHVNASGTVAAGTHSEEVIALSLQSFQSFSAKPDACVVTAVAPVTTDRDEIWAGCTDGSITRYGFDATTGLEVLETVTLDASLQPEVLQIVDMGGYGYVIADLAGLLRVYSVGASGTPVLATGPSSAPSGFAGAMQHDGRLVIAHDDAISIYNEDGAFSFNGFFDNEVGAFEGLGPYIDSDGSSELDSYTILADGALYNCGLRLDVEGTMACIQSSNASLGSVVAVSTSAPGDTTLAVVDEDGALAIKGLQITGIEGIVSLSATTTVEDGADGTNPVAVSMVSDQFGLVTRESGGVDLLASVPSRPAVSGVRVASGRISVDFTDPGDSDLDSYTLYISESAFNSWEYAEGGPSDITPVSLSAVDVDSGAENSISATGLVDGTTYYVAVRPQNASGEEGRMSEVNEATPQVLLGSSDLAADPGGLQCNSASGGGSLGWLSALFLPFLMVRRGKGLRFLTAAVLGLSSTAAMADDEDGPAMSEGYREAVAENSVERGDLSPAWGNIEVRGSYWDGLDSSIEDVYDRSAAWGLRVEAGAQLYRLVELDVSVGRTAMSAAALTENSLETGDENVNLTIYPMTASAAFRLHILDEQVLVPYAAGGPAMWHWRERVGTGDTKTVKSGTHLGFLGEVGFNLLLDTFDRDRASLLEAQTGINDTWLTFAYRSFSDGADEGFDFGGSVYEIGLKLDF